MNEIWTVGRILEWIEGFLGEHGDANPRLSAQWLVSDALGCSRIQLYADLERPLSDDERDVLRAYTRRRASGEPLQYITGTTDFRFVTLSVEPGVLIPRPETEVLVSEAIAELAKCCGGDRFQSSESVDDRSVPDEELLRNAVLVEADGEGLCLQLESGDLIPVRIDRDGDVVLRSSPAEREPVTVVDLCSGSGNIACSVASEVPDSVVFATDVSPAACALARKNVSTLGLEERVVVLECDLGESLPSEIYGTVDLVVSNPPYIPTDEMAVLDREVAVFEPRLALDGGPDGLDVFRRILPLALKLLKPDGVLAVELHETCLDAACGIAESSGFAHVRIAHDLAGRPRVLVARTESCAHPHQDD